MPNETPSPYTPRPQNHPQQGAEVYPLTGTHGNVPWQNGHQTGVNYAHGRNDASYGDWAQYHSYAWNESLAPPSVGQYAYPNHSYAPPGHAPHYLAASGPPPVGYYIPPAHGIPNNAPPTAIPHAADPISQNVPNSDSGPFRTSAVADLKHLANRYLHNPNSRVDTLRMGSSPSGRRFLVMILLEVDDIV
ncbi:hypothetical protein EI94DRAFT_1814255 [Lactarius quietus]|nr:hypothetical protein EI94DRAFT_1814255 [Lactarius quietus]